MVGPVEWAQVVGLTAEERLRHASYSLNSLKLGYIGDYLGDYYRAYEGGY